MPAGRRTLLAAVVGPLLVTGQWPTTASIDGWACVADGQPPVHTRLGGKPAVAGAIDGFCSRPTDFLGATGSLGYSPIFREGPYEHSHQVHVPGTADNAAAGTLVRGGLGGSAASVGGT